MTTKQMELTDEQRSDCWKKRARKISWENIAKVFHVTGQTLRYALNPEANERRLIRARERQRALQIAKGKTIARNMVHFDRPNNFVLSEDILAERDRRQAMPYADFTSEWLGDPKPGFSALDKKRALGLWK